MRPQRRSQIKTFLCLASLASVGLLLATCGPEPEARCYIPGGIYDVTLETLEDGRERIDPAYWDAYSGGIGGTCASDIREQIAGRHNYSVYVNPDSIPCDQPQLYGLRGLGSADTDAEGRCDVTATVYLDGSEAGLAPTPMPIELDCDQHECSVTMVATFEYRGPRQD